MLFLSVVLRPIVVVITDALEIGQFELNTSTHDTAFAARFCLYVFRCNGFASQSLCVIPAIRIWKINLKNHQPDN